MRGANVILDMVAAITSSAITTQLRPMAAWSRSVFRRAQGKCHFAKLMVKRLHHTAPRCGP